MPGLRVVFLDLTRSGVATFAMLEDASLPGVTEPPVLGSAVLGSHSRRSLFGVPHHSDRYGRRRQGDARDRPPSHHPEFARDRLRPRRRGMWPGQRPAASSAWRAPGQWSCLVRQSPRTSTSRPRPAILRPAVLTISSSSRLPKRCRWHLRGRRRPDGIIRKWERALVVLVGVASGSAPQTSHQPLHRGRGFHAPLERLERQLDAGIEATLCRERQDHVELVYFLIATQRRFVVFVADAVVEDAVPVTARGLDALEGQELAGAELGSDRPRDAAEFADDPAVNATGSSNGPQNPPDLQGFHVIGRLFLFQRRGKTGA